MMTSRLNRYQFTDDWYVAAEPDVTRELLRRVEDWPTWWPSSLSVVPVRPLVPGATEASRYTFQTRLPYRMVFQADVVHDSPSAVETVVVGRVHGVGGWHVTPTTGGSRVHFDWSVDLQVLWMRALSLLARPVFVWNHQALMAEGAGAFADRLGVEMLRRPGCTPSLRSTAGQLAVGIALSGGLTLMVRRRRSIQTRPRTSGVRRRWVGPGGQSAEQSGSRWHAYRGRTHGLQDPRPAGDLGR